MPLYECVIFKDRLSGKVVCIGIIWSQVILAKSVMYVNIRLTDWGWQAPGIAGLPAGRPGMVMLLLLQQ